MKLAAYLIETSQTESDFAEKILVTQTAVNRYVNGQRIPRPQVMQRITAASEGKVTANDFHGEAEEANAA